MTGETAPVAISPGASVYAGTMNMSGALRVRVRSAASGTLLDEVNGLLVRAVEQRSSYVRLADRAAALYVPVVHVTALATFLGWLALGAGWQQSLVVAITVLIITCPCALGLAVPAVQVVAAGALFKRGLILNSGEALERLAEVDTVVFDKTGTLTQPRPTLANAADVEAGDLALAGSLALASRHPLAKAVAEAFRATEPIAAEEFPGQGVSALYCGERVRLGSVAWCEAEAEAAPVAAAWPDASLIALRTPARAVVFAVRQALRPDACAVVADLALRPRRRDPVGGSRGCGRPRRARARRGAVRSGADAGRQDRAAESPSERGQTSADGRRRAQRRPGARHGACLDLARSPPPTSPRRRPTRSSSASVSRRSRTRSVSRPRRAG